MRARGGVLFLIGAALLWGTTGTTRALAPQEIHPLALGAARLVVAALVLLAWARFRRSDTRRAPWPHRALLATALGIAAYQATFFVGVMRLGVATGTVLAIGSAPFFAGVLGRVFLGERLDGRWWTATALGIAGLLLLAPPTRAVDAVGLMCALGAGLSYAAYAAASRPVVEARGPDASMAGSFALAALVSLPLLFLLPGVPALASAEGALALAHLGILATAVAYLLFARAVERLPIATVATLSLLEPATAVTLGVVVLGERLDVLGFAGLAAILGSIALLSMPTSREARDPLL